MLIRTFYYFLSFVMVLVLTQFEVNANLLVERSSQSTISPADSYYSLHVGRGVSSFLLGYTYAFVDKDFDSAGKEFEFEQDHKSHIMNLGFRHGITDYLDLIINTAFIKTDWTYDIGDGNQDYTAFDMTDSEFKLSMGIFSFLSIGLGAKFPTGNSFFDGKNILTSEDYTSLIPSIAIRFSSSWIYMLVSGEYHHGITDLSSYLINESGYHTTYKPGGKIVGSCELGISPFSLAGNAVFLRVGGKYIKRFPDQVSKSSEDQQPEYWFEKEPDFMEVDPTSFQKMILIGGLDFPLSKAFVFFVSYNHPLMAKDTFVINQNYTIEADLPVQRYVVNPFISNYTEIVSGISIFF